MKRLALLLIGCLVASPLIAKRASAETPAAEALFEEGVSLFERGALPQACAKFEASEALDVAVGTLLRLADCYERTGRLASAWSRFREAGSLAQAQAMPERERIAAVRADALRPKMARLTINVAPRAPAGIRVRLDGAAVPRASWGTALPVDAGTWTLEASAPGFVAFQRKVTIPAADGAHIGVTIPLLEPEPAYSSDTFALAAPTQRPGAPATPTDSTALAEDRGYGARVLGATLAVVGGAGLAGSGVFAVLSAKRNDRSLDYCGDDVHFCTPRGVELRREAGRLADIATVSAAAGGALLVTGIVVYAAAPSKRESQRISLSAIPDAAAGGVTLQMRGAF